MSCATPGTGCQPRSSATRSGLTTDSSSASATSKISWPCVASPSPTSRSGAGARRSAPPTRDASGIAPAPLGHTWHLDELFVTIRGQRHYLWRAVDQDGEAIDVLLQPRRDRRAAARFLRRLLKWCGRVPH